MPKTCEERKFQCTEKSSRCSYNLFNKLTQFRAGYHLLRYLYIPNVTSVFWSRHKVPLPWNIPVIVLKTRTLSYKTRMQASTSGNERWHGTTIPPPGPICILSMAPARSCFPFWSMIPSSYMSPSARQLAVFPQSFPDFHVPAIAQSFHSAGWVLAWD